MRVGWLADIADLLGGAEITQAEFRDAAPEGVEIVDCPPGGVVPGLDAYVIHNSVQYTLTDYQVIGDAPAVKYWHDVGPWITPECRAWLDAHGTYVCCSPIQAEHMGVSAHLIPPPVNLARFSDAAEDVNGGRSGNVSVGSWRNHGKAPHKVAEWAAQNQTPVDFFGGGPLAPPGSVEMAYEGMPALLAQYETFVFLPTVIEPFGRVVAEAWAAGCGLVVNEHVGAVHWITENPGAMETAAHDFWAVIEAC